MQQMILTNNIKTLKLFFVSVLFILALPGIFSAECGASTITSRWRDRAIIIDGKSDEWQDRKISINSQDVVFGIFNDENYLYLHMYCWDKNLCRLMMMSGFTVWFNNYDDDKKLGIRFPIGMTHLPGFSADKQKPMEPEQTVKLLEDMFKKIEIINAKGAHSIRNQFEFLKEIGLEVAIGNSSGNIIYELKIPIVKNSQHPYALSDNNLKQVDVCFEIPEPEMPKSERMSGDNPGNTWNKSEGESENGNNSGMGGHRMGGGMSGGRHGGMHGAHGMHGGKRNPEGEDGEIGNHRMHSDSTGFNGLQLELNIELASKPAN